VIVQADPGVVVAFAVAIEFRPTGVETVSETECAGAGCGVGGAAVGGAAVGASVGGGVVAWVGLGVDVGSDVDAATAACELRLGTDVTGLVGATVERGLAVDRAASVESEHAVIAAMSMEPLIAH
jgi:hypothetical protein